MEKRTKIVCTLGPASETMETIETMVDSGMNVARLNFSHGTHENHRELIARVKNIRKKTGHPITILQDLQGPKIRVGELSKDGVLVQKDDVVILNTNIDQKENNDIPIDYEDFHTIVKSGERVFIADGAIELVITGVTGTKIETKVVFGGEIHAHKGINIPDSNVQARALTEKDKKDAYFGIQEGVDMMALSFVTTPQDIEDLRVYITKSEKELGITRECPIQIIAKIERKEAVEDIDNILDVADGIMVARGDLGVEVPVEDVPVIQKRLISAALLKAKPVIVATQMLDSMQEHQRPTRAEVSDVANAVIDHADALMLSNETATGKYPIEVVKTMADIIKETEDSEYDNLSLYKTTKDEDLDNIESIMTKLSRISAEEMKAKVILTASLSGKTGRRISRYRPELPIVVATGSKEVSQQLNLSWGIVPFVALPCDSLGELIDQSIVYLKENGLVEKKDTIVVIAGEPVGESNHINTLEVREVE
ncbi:MAG: pyruvate kinase [Candidatus Magasanikbacteria bacterium]|nr:pyruvate kinase [Candidatus Magasanikbacteria bacterium]